VIQAGFPELAITAVEFPAAMALTAVRGSAGESLARARSLGPEIAQLRRREKERAQVIGGRKGSTPLRIASRLEVIERSVRRMLRR